MGTYNAKSIFFENRRRLGVSWRYILPSNFLLLSGVLSAMNADSSPANKKKDITGEEQDALCFLLYYASKGRVHMEKINIKTLNPAMRSGIK